MRRTCIGIFTSAVLLLLCGTIDSRERIQLRIEALYPSARWIGNGILEVGFTCPASMDMPATGRIRIEPVYDDGRRITIFPSVVYLSESGARYFRRRREYGEKDASMPVWRLVTAGSVKDGGPDDMHDGMAAQVTVDMFRYTDTLAVGGGEKGGIVRFLYWYEDCCRESLVASDSIRVPSGIVRQLMPYPVLVSTVPADVSFTEPAGESVKTRRDTITASLHFRQGRYDIDPDYMDNAALLGKFLLSAERLLTDSTCYRILYARLRGYASPEGRNSYNMELSGKRARSFSDFLSRNCGIPALESEGMGEDWDGLERYATADLRLPDREAILHVIGDRDRTGTDRCKTLMESIGDGEGYRYLYSKYFPQLRRIGLYIEYEVAHVEGDEAGKIYDERPGDLDSRETYHVAADRNGILLSPDQGYTGVHCTGDWAWNNAETDGLLSGTDAEDFGDGFYAAAEMFPDDPATLINAASAALIRHDMVTAYRYLMRVQNDSRAWNNIGVYCLLCGEMEAAEYWFIRAQSVMPDIASRNLGVLREAAEKAGVESHGEIPGTAHDDVPRAGPAEWHGGRAG